LNSLAIGGIATTALALAAGLTLIPALLAGWGRKITPIAPVSAEDGPFGRLARRVQRRPIIVVVLAGATLVAAGLPFLSVNYGSGDPRTLPASFESRQVNDTLLARFPGKQADPIQVVAQLPGNDPRAQAEPIASAPCPVSPPSPQRAGHDGAALPDDRLGAGPAQGHRHEHPVPRCHLRRAGMDLPGRPPVRPARLPGLRRGRGVVPHPGFAFAFGLSMDYEVSCCPASRKATTTAAPATTRLPSGCSAPAGSSPPPPCWS
jgi:uncharacterized membrane protein YdfJ with MMPL/SSD domain